MKRLKKWRLAIMTTLDRIIADALGAFRPPPKLSLSEWANRYAYLSPESSAETGRWKTLPYQKGIMDAITDPAVERVTVMKSARVGYTKILNNAIGYYIHQDPCTILVVQPTVEDSEGYSKDEIAPMIRDAPVLAELVAESGSRKSSNTIRKKMFPGGWLLMIGANSPTGFRRVSARIVLFDEVDGYPESAGAEGDQIKLGTRRSDYFSNRKIVLGSTPTLYETSRIRKSYEQSDMRRFYVPCPYCGEYQDLRWENLKWDEGKPETVKYICEHCKKPIDHSQKRRMLDRGEWRASELFKGHAGFHIWAGYSLSPNATWEKLAEEFESLQDEGEKRTFWNTVLGRAWEGEDVEIDEDALKDKRVEYGAELPEGVLVLTAGVDVQGDRLEYEIAGWGEHKESWGIEYGILPGNPALPEVWQQLDRVLMKQWTFKDGFPLEISRVCVDSGYMTNTVYEYCSTRGERGIYAVKGISKMGAPIISRPTEVKKYKIHMFPVGVNAGKDFIYGRLKVENGENEKCEEGKELAKSSAGGCHFPIDIRGYDDTYFRGLTSERRNLRYKNSQPVFVWEKKHKHARNEPLDCRNYALAALEIFRPHFPTMAYALEERRKRGAAASSSTTSTTPRKRRVIHPGFSY